MRGNLMKAIVINKFGDASQLHLADLPKPEPKDNEVQIQIAFAAINPVDWKIREGLLQSRMPYQFPIILGWDASGIISALGKNVTGLKVGDAVYAYCKKPIIQWGTYAEFVCFDSENVVLKPKNLSHAQASSIPLAGLTAWQSLISVGLLKKGEVVLIHGGAGGVGSLGIQFAKSVGAIVITTASAENHDYVKERGADYIIDYRTKNFVDEVKKIFPNGIDLVFDTQGGKTLQDSLEVVKSNGRIISLIEKLDPKIAEQRHIQFHYVFVSPNGKDLKEITSLIEKGKVKTPKIEEMPLTETRKAHEKVQSHSAQGKIVLDTSK